MNEPSEPTKRVEPSDVVLTPETSMETTAESSIGMPVRAETSSSSESFAETDNPGLPKPPKKVDPRWYSGGLLMTIAVALSPIIFLMGTSLWYFVGPQLPGAREHRTEERRKEFIDMKTKLLQPGYREELLRAAAGAGQEIELAGQFDRLWILKGTKLVEVKDGWEIQGLVKNPTPRRAFEVEVVAKFFDPARSGDVRATDLGIASVGDLDVGETKPFKILVDGGKNTQWFLTEARFSDKPLPRR